MRGNPPLVSFCVLFFDFLTGVSAGGDSSSLVSVKMLLVIGLSVSDSHLDGDLSLALGLVYFLNSLP